ncbi:hypothetical protein ACFU99_36990 [Streptomyces sp. NPDC057654]|uniref:hypothetical protein n=1 Tax=Streptomyces sp. NPDC057654 TaxID=3346196 RepID=UPI0036988A83
MLSVSPRRCRPRGRVDCRIEDAAELRADAAAPTHPAKRSEQPDPHHITKENSNPTELVKLFTVYISNTGERRPGRA